MVSWVLVEWKYSVSSLKILNSDPPSRLQVSVTLVPTLTSGPAGVSVSTGVDDGLESVGNKVQ